MRCRGEIFIMTQERMNRKRKIILKVVTFLSGTAPDEQVPVEQI